MREGWLNGRVEEGQYLGRLGSLAEGDDLHLGIRLPQRAQGVEGGPPALAEERVGPPVQVDDRVQSLHVEAHHERLHLPVALVPPAPAQHPPLYSMFEV